MTKFGLSENILTKIRNVFANEPKVREVILYGSRAMGNYREGSDIDIALTGKELELSDLLKISAELDQLDLPYGFDLLLLEKIENTNLIEHIKRVGVTIY